MRIPQVNILGVGVSALTMETALQTMAHWLSQREPHYVCVTGVHGIMASQHDARLRHIHNAAGLVTPDGMPLVWLSRLAGWRHVQRVYGPDLLLAACAHPRLRQYRHFFYGGAPGVAATLADRLHRRFPGLTIAGIYCPPFRPLTPDEDRAVIAQIRATRADLVWVGLSTPKQEYWMASHVQHLGAPVLIGVGAAFDFVAGVKRQAPRWMQRSGLEWCFRCLQEPRRLGPRYLRHHPAFLWCLLRTCLAHPQAQNTL